MIEANRCSRRTRLRQHLFRRIDTHHAPERSDAKGRDEAIKPARSTSTTHSRLRNGRSSNGLARPANGFHRCVGQCLNDSRIIAEARCKWLARMEVKVPCGFGCYLSVFLPAPSRSASACTATLRLIGAPYRSGHDAGQTTAGTALRFQGRASRIMLNGVSVARRILVKPPVVMTSRSLASPACAPSAVPTSCDSEVGIQIIVEAA